MLFNSFQFLVFFLVVTTLYFWLPYKKRWFLLLVSSCYFYMAFVPIYILILGFTIVIDYFAALYIEKASGKRRKLFLIYSLIANIGVLAVFKYYNFLNDNLSWFLRGFSLENPVPFLSILLPIGLSFHTFQAMSYTIEVYRGNQKPERHFGIYALYVMFYPQLVAGPIERPQNLLHQFRENYTFDYNRVTVGLRLMVWGFFKKVVIADRLALVVNQVYSNPTDQNGITYLIATIFFAFQIYCDFSGYSDIAIGAAKIMGFNLMKNFNIPYISKSIGEFWQRWHISLSTWFRDYVYIPLGGNRVVKWRWYYNLYITFFISGLWHGAKWTFIIWGSLHGFYLVVEKLIGLDNRFKKKKWLIPFQVTITFVLVLFAWIFFRSNSVDQATTIIKKITQNIVVDLKHYFQGIPVFNGFGQFDFKDICVLFSLIVFLYIVEVLQTLKVFQTIYHKYFLFRFLIYFFLFYSIVFGGYFGEVQFIYFQF